MRATSDRGEKGLLKSLRNLGNYFFFILEIFLGVSGSINDRTRVCWGIGAWGGVHTRSHVAPSIAALSRQLQIVDTNHNHVFL